MIFLLAGATSNGVSISKGTLEVVVLFLAALVLLLILLGKLRRP